ncbi:hypothetical protein BGW80DRAFT_1329742 [Lactifluus volemus]|nr:hypothetical protein BGW80DRAFT_1329742 [Lactifluus volemus]
MQSINIKYFQNDIVRKHLDRDMSVVIACSSELPMHSPRGRYNSTFQTKSPRTSCHEC